MMPAVLLQTKLLLDVVWFESYLRFMCSDALFLFFYHEMTATEFHPPTFIHKFINSLLALTWGETRTYIE